MQITVQKLESFPPNSNPFHYDAFHMGQTVGQNLEMMYANHPSEPCKYLIFVDTKTGERIRIVFS